MKTYLKAHPQLAVGNFNRAHGGNIWQVGRRCNIRPEEVIDFSSNINPLGLSPKAKARIKDTLHLVHAYPEPDGDQLREELARFHSLPCENILVGNGSTEFIYLIPQAFKAGKALVIEPGFSEYRNPLVLAGCRGDTFLTREDNDFIPDITGLTRSLKKGYDLLYLSNPANPTGVLLSKDEVLEIAGVCRRYGTVLVIDEAFIDFVEATSIKREATTMDNIIVLRSMTKFFAMAGLRLGYVISSGGIIRMMEGFRPPWSVNTMAIVAGVEALRDRNYIMETLDWFMCERPFLFEGLKATPGLRPYPSAANFFLVRILSGLTSSVLQEAFLRRGILVRDCSSFRGLGDTFFRVSIKKREENEILLKGLNDLVSIHGHA